MTEFRVVHLYLEGVDGVLHKSPINKPYKSTGVCG